CTMLERLSPSAQSDSQMPNALQRSRLRKIRRFKDHLSRYGVGAAGMVVVGSLALIFLYLFSEVAPLLKSSEIDVATQYQAPIAGPSMPAEHLLLERYEEIGASFTRAGMVNFFNAETGLIIDSLPVPRPDDGEFSALGTSVPAAGLVVYGYTSG